MTSIPTAATGARVGGEPRVVVGIPTVGRGDILYETVRQLAQQTRVPDLVLICVSDPRDTGGAEMLDLPFMVEVLISARGLTRQRNRIMNALRADDLLLFLDDDFLVAPDYLQQMVQVFADHPDVVLATGTVVADGILGPGLDLEAGTRLLRKALKTPAGNDVEPAHTGYGCNTALRMSAILEHDVFFDERLPLYGWLEDVDFSTRLHRHGQIVQPAAMRGVHLGTKTGRTPGVRLGYSQIANPWYMIRKGTIGRKRARDLMLRNLASNLRGTVFPVGWADYRGRFRGNLLAIADLVMGRSDPERVLRL